MPSQSKNNRDLSFPPGFLWGASTSAHQVEGGNHNDWSEFEKIHAPKAAAAAQAVYRAGQTVWGDDQQESTNVDNYISGQADDSYHRYDEDFKIAHSLHMNAHRFSIEWSRIEPIEGQFDEKEISHYRQVIRALKELGIEPCVTLWHYTLPLWMASKGGWLNRQSPEYFRRFVERIVREYKDDVKIWFTLNEPEIYARHAYLLGDRPPEKKSLWQLYRVTRHLITAHHLAYTSIKEIDPTAQVGVAKDVYSFYVSQPTLKNRLTLKLSHWFSNKLFFNQIHHHQDFLGLNYYVNFKVDFSKPGRRKLEDMGWQGAAAGLPWLMQQLKRYNKPIYITENGTIDAHDVHRADYIKEIISKLHQTIREEADVRGYFHWSLLDNFEWNSGYYLRFGLVVVDRVTLKRTVRSSAKYYATIIKDNGLPNASHSDQVETADSRTDSN